MSEKKFTWVPFYKELAEKLLEYKNNRKELVDFVYAENGLKAFTPYIHLKNEGVKVPDIDPFSFFAIFNRQIKDDTRKNILKIIQTKFELKTELPNDFDSIPVLNNLRSFYYVWEDEQECKKSCDKLWIAYEDFLNEKSLTDFFNSFNFKTRQAELTIPLFWIKPENYLPLDKNNKSYLEKHGLNSKNVTDYDTYTKLLNNVKDAMNSGKIKEKSFPEFSYNAWKQNNTQGDTDMSNANNIITNYTKLLQANRNLILTGAPGTGKTHLAKEVAKAMGCTDDEIGFVQFHPSYDYTDFVEGLRPKNDDDGNVGFERRDGVFKKFCKNALKNLEDSKKDKSTLSKEKFYEEVLHEFLDEAIENEKSFKTKNGKTSVSVKEYDDSRIYLVSDKTDNVSIKYEDVLKILNSNVKLDRPVDITNLLHPKHAETRDSYIFPIVKEIKEKYNYKNHNAEHLDFVDDTEQELIKEKPFVFIIDEINRGEISKIFGELFFSIDPGYRGLDENGKPKGLVQTQYQNLIQEKDDDVFFDGFYVPENVYIIGTMNDIDRSVESMDFAFRRRFAFAEVKAKDTQSMLDKEEAWKPNEKPSEDTVTKIKNRMDNLNKAISDLKSEGLSSAYHIGASYFLKLQNYDGDFDELWKYHIKGLLYEYLRGNPNADDLIGDLKSAYDNENQIAEKQDAESQVEETE